MSTVGRDGIRVTVGDAEYLLGVLEGAGIEAWVAGGWGLDALLGRQTREHRDLDIILPLPQTLTAYSILLNEGFRVETDWFPVRFEMLDSLNRAVDVHPVRVHDDGSADLEMLDGGLWHFDAEAMSGRGTIGTKRVRCQSVREQIRSHTGYEPTDIDRADMALLAEHFGVELPEPYRNL